MVLLKLFSTEWAAPKTYYLGFEFDDIDAGNYGDSIHVWDWETKEHQETLTFGEEGIIPLEIRMLHNPEVTESYVGATLSSNIIHF